MDEIAQTQHRNKHQTKGQQQNGLGHGEEFAFGYPPAVGKQQWWNEQQQEQLGVKRDMQTLLRPGDQGTDADLNQGKRNPAHVTRGNAGHSPKHQDQQNDFNGVHAAFFSSFSRASFSRIQKPRTSLGISPERQASCTKKPPANRGLPTIHKETI